jgi:hypothetical protein
MTDLLKIGRSAVQLPHRAPFLRAVPELLHLLLSSSHVGGQFLMSLDRGVRVPEVTSSAGIGGSFTLACDLSKSPEGCAEPPSQSRWAAIFFRRQWLLIPVRRASRCRFGPAGFVAVGSAYAAAGMVSPSSACTSALLTAAANMPLPRQWGANADKMEVSEAAQGWEELETPSLSSAS